MIPDTSSVYRQKAWQTFVSEKRKEQEFMSFDFESSPPDSHPLPFLPDEIECPLPLRDEVTEMMKKRNDGIGVLPSVSDLISNAIQQEASKDIPPQFNFIPTKIQVHAIRVLKEHRKSTQIDIYALLDPALPVTAETLNKNLEILVDKGFLSRKKISPQHAFNFFGIPIEMSARNRKNPVYVYELKISEKTLVDFLQAQLTLAGDRLRTHPTDSVRIRSRMESLQQKIHILIR
jgi:hypothetical protein